MNSLFGFYRQTWWLWLLFVAVFALLANYVTILFLLMIPGIILYSVYFGVVRVSELNEAERLRAREPKPDAALPPRPAETD